MTRLHVLRILLCIRTVCTTYGIRMKTRGALLLYIEGQLYMTAISSIVDGSKSQHKLVPFDHNRVAQNKIVDQNLC